LFGPPEWFLRIWTHKPIRSSKAGKKSFSGRW